MFEYFTTLDVDQMVGGGAAVLAGVWWAVTAVDGWIHSGTDSLEDHQC